MLSFDTGDALPARGRRGGLEGGAARPARGGARRPAAGHRAGPDRAWQGRSSSSPRPSRRPAARCASTRRPSRGSCRSGASGTRRELGLQLDPEAAKELVARSGSSQQRLSREIEKIALAVHPRRTSRPPTWSGSPRATRRPGAYDLADALVAGDLEATLALAEQLDAQGERPGRLVFPVVRRLREVHQAASLLDAGVPEPRSARR